MYESKMHAKYRSITQNGAKLGLYAEKFLFFCRELYAEMREEHYASLEERKFKTLAQVNDKCSFLQPSLRAEFM